MECGGLAPLWPPSLGDLQRWEKAAPGRRTPRSWLFRKMNQVARLPGSWTLVRHLRSQTVQPETF
jgi:hypothetical protein